MKNRSRIDIAASILAVAEGGSKKTNIMYKAFISTPQVNEYFGLLLKEGLMEYIKEEGMYYTTDKGKLILSKYKQVMQELYSESKPVIPHIRLA